MTLFAGAIILYAHSSTLRTLNVAVVGLWCGGLFASRTDWAVCSETFSTVIHPFFAAFLASCKYRGLAKHLFKGFAKPVISVNSAPAISAQIVHVKMVC